MSASIFIQIDNLLRKIPATVGLFAMFLSSFSSTLARMIVLYRSAGFSALVRTLVVNVCS